MLTIVILVAVFGLLVLVHEWGHFIAARRSGVKVEEFGFGFPPRLFGIKRGETLYSINLFPLGGFVKLYGETEDGEDTKKPRSFATKPVRTRFKIVVAGVVMNVLLGLVLFIGLNLFGLPVATENGADVLPHEIVVDPFSVRLAEVVKDSPAAAAGLKPGDKVLTAAGREITNSTDLHDISCELAGQEIPLTYARGGNTAAVAVESVYPQITVTKVSEQARTAGLKSGDTILMADGRTFTSADRPLGETSEVCRENNFYAYLDELGSQTATLKIKREHRRLIGEDTTEELNVISSLDGVTAEIKRGAIGVQPIGVKVVRFPFLTAVKNGIENTVFVLLNIFYGFYLLFATLMRTGTVLEGAAGPVGIGLMLHQLVQMGSSFVLFFAATLSINLAVLNVLPIPALDGGKLVFLSLEGIRRKKVKTNVENIIHLIGFVLLIALVIFLTYTDVSKFF